METFAGNGAIRAREILDQLRAAGHQAYFVGGCVRDLLLGRTPKDYDIATDARPDRVLSLFPQGIPVGAHFGVVLVDQVEVATFRADLSYADGRRPERVEYETSPEADAHRRDFSINGLFLDPVSGHVLDFVGGQADLENGVIRAIGDPGARFAEDHLRLLRAIRFAARFGYRIESGTFAAIREHASRIRAIAAERIRDELNRILTEGGARSGFELLDETGLLIEVLPEISAMKGVQQPPQFHPEGDVWTHTLLMIEGLREPSLTLAWGVLLHDVGKPPTFRRAADRIRFDGHAELGARMAVEILTRLRQPQDDIEQVRRLVAHHLDWMNIRNMRASTLKRFFRLPSFDEHLELHRLDCRSSHRRLENYQFAVDQLARMPADQLRPPPLINGRDLIEAGVTPGPVFRKILDAVEDAQLEARIATREEALALALSLSPPPPPASA